MEPDLLHDPMGVPTRLLQTKELLQASVDGLPGDEPTQALGARRGGQTAGVGEVVAEHVGFSQRDEGVHPHALDARGVVDSQQLRRQLFEEGGFLARGEVDAQADDGGRFALFVHVHEVHLGLGPHAVD